MTRTILDIHVLQTVPPSNINRDDTGAPKTAFYGGVLRSRVSSQAWKRATRTAFREYLDPAELGTRTKRVAEFLAERIGELDPAIPETERLTLAAETVKAATGSKVEPPKRRSRNEDDEQAAPESSYLMFLSARQRDALAAIAVEAKNGPAEFFKNRDNKASAKAAADTDHSVDIALFGRMVADGADINVDAAAQVAHAISVHAVENEADYYTAVDDRRRDEEPGAGMIGTVEFNSATLYRYAAVDVNRLQDNLGAGIRENQAPATPVRRAVEAFVRGFVESMPTGKANTFANHTLPEAVVVKLRTSRPVSFASAFEEPVSEGVNELGHRGGYLEGASRALAKHVPAIESAYGTDTETQTWVLRVGDATADLVALGTEVSLADLVEGVGEAVETRLGRS